MLQWFLRKILLIKFYVKLIKHAFDILDPKWKGFNKNVYDKNIKSTYENYQ